MKKKSKITASQKKIRDAFQNHSEVEIILSTEDLVPSEEERVIRFAAYCRVSTDEENQSGSYELQVQHFKEMEKKRANWKLVDIYADQGISGTSLKHRDEFYRMMNDCKTGKIDLIIVKNVFRFSRNIVDCLECVRMLKGLNPPVGVFFESENINTLTQTGEMMLALIATVGQSESEAKSQAITWGFRKRFEQGLPKLNRLYGYDRENGSDIMTIREAEAKVVRKIHKMFVNHLSVGEIRMTLAAEGIPSPTGLDIWPYATIYGILENEKYCGDVLMQKTVTVDIFTHKSVKNTGQARQYKIKDHHPAIVSRELKEDVLKILKEGKQEKEWRIVLGDNNEEGELEGFIPVYTERI